MKKIKFLILICVLLISVVPLIGCGTQPDHPSDKPGNNGTVPGVETVEGTASTMTAEAERIIAGEVKSPEKMPVGATEILGKITIASAGDYYVKTSLEGKKITVESENVHLYLNGATLSNEKKVIESSYDLTITVFGKNEISNSNVDGSTAIDCVGDLIINGSGLLAVTSAKNGIKANSITVIDSTLEINCDKDGLHAEIDAYDNAEAEPTPSYNDGGYVYLNGATVDITSADDGIQADTFVYVKDSVITVNAGGGAPNTVNSTTSDNASGKGIKAGALDWGAASTDLDWDGYLVCIKSGTVTVNSNDDAIHSDGDTEICGGSITVYSGDDGIHADNNSIISGGNIRVLKSYEGIEGTNINISGGEIFVDSVDDGLNAAGGADNSGFGGGWGRPGTGFPGNMPRTTSSPNDSTPSIKISGGIIYVNSSADGMDSNGNITVSGGEIYISGPTSGMDVAIDYDGTAQITGGVVVAVSRLNGMTQNFGSGSTQGSALLAISSMGTGDVKLKDDSGNILLSYSPTKNYNSVIISCPQLVKGNSYTVSACGKNVSMTLSDLIFNKNF